MQHLSLSNRPQSSAHLLAHVYPALRSSQVLLTGPSGSLMRQAVCPVAWGYILEDGT